MSEKRKQILAAAKSLFVECGLGGTTIAQIAQKAGIAKGSVYTHFKSKQAIVIALMQGLIDRGRSGLNAIIADESCTGQARLEAYIAQELSLMNEERALNQAIAFDESLMLNEDMMEMLQNYRNDYYQNQVLLLHSVYGESIDKWQMDIVSLLNGAFHEYGMLITVDNAFFDTRQCAKVIAKALDGALSALNESDLESVVSSAMLSQAQTNTEQTPPTPEQLIFKLKEQASDLPKEHQYQVEQTCELLLQSLQSNNSNDVLHRALIANLSPYQGLNATRVLLAERLDVPII